MNALPVEGGAAWTDLLRTARLEKVLPLLATPCAGFLLAGSEQWTALSVALVSILAAAVVVTRLNVATDAPLDAGTRPELMAMMRRSRGPILRACVLELLLTLAGATLLVAWGFVASALAVLSVLGLGILYSFNFLSPRPVATRWKTHWVGHGAVFLGGHGALWVAGCGLGALASPALAFPLIAALVLTDYAVYLGEAAIDASEEQQAGLRTAAALLGEKRSAEVGLALCLVGTVILGATLPGMQLAWVLMPPAVARLGFLAVLTWQERRGRPAAARKLRHRGADIAFFASRLWLVTGLLLTGGLSVR